MRDGMKFIRQHSTLYDRNGSFIPTKRNADWLHGVAEDMCKALEKIASGKSCDGELCQDYDCVCDMKVAKAALAKARGELT